MKATLTSNVSRSGNIQLPHHSLTERLHSLSVHDTQTLVLEVTFREMTRIKAGPEMPEQ